MAELFEEQTHFQIVEPDATQTLSAHMNELGCSLGDTTTEQGLIGYGDKQPLGIHSETIYNDKMCRYFLLGCVQQAVSGGESVIYDGLRAASIVYDMAPELSDIKLKYRVNASESRATESRLIRELVSGERTLCFRQQYILDSIERLPCGWDAHLFYAFMDTVLDQSLVYDRVLRPGEIAVVDNFRTLHGRRPYRGLRKMLRVRVDE